MGTSNISLDEITVNGEIYAKKGTVFIPAKNIDGMPFCIVRTYSAGVFAGYIESREDKIVTIRNAIRLWQWAGAASLSQLAMEGVTKPKECKFAIPVDQIVVTEAIEILSCSEAARLCIEGVRTWAV